MNEARSRQGNGSMADPNRQPLGQVARDMMDHISMIARDEAKIARLSVKRYTEHVREDVAPKALFGAGAAVCGALAGVFGLIALFLGIAYALGSVAWTFLIFCGLFAIATIVMVGLMKKPRVETSEQIARHFPAVDSRSGMPEHALARQATPAGHREVTLEAEREASREMLTPHSAVLGAEDQATRMGATNGERRVIFRTEDGQGAVMRR